MEVNVFVATHKLVENINSNVYKLIQVGADLNENLGYLADNTGDNISKKNKSYCDLTALYWIWKNNQSDYVGLCHYRRFFCKKNLITKKFKILNDKDIYNLIRKYDLILPREACLPLNIYEHYCENHYKKDLDFCFEAIQKFFPEYVDTYNETMHQNKIRLFNMFIGKKEIMNEYFSWLFTILGYVESKIDIREYSDYQKRVFGYLSERLFNVWINHNKMNYSIKEIFVMNTEDGKVL